MTLSQRGIHFIGMGISGGKKGAFLGPSLMPGGEALGMDEELEAVQNELASAMQGQGDRELATLMALGGWLRTIEIVSGHLAGHYSAEGAALLRQPAVCNFFTARVGEMPARIQAAPLVVAIRDGLPQIQKLVSFSPDLPPSADDVRKLNEAAGGIIAAIAGKEK